MDVFADYWYNTKRKMISYSGQAGYYLTLYDRDDRVEELNNHVHLVRVAYKSGRGATAKYEFLFVIKKLVYESWI